MSRRSGLDGLISGVIKSSIRAAKAADREAKAYQRRQLIAAQKELREEERQQKEDIKRAKLWDINNQVDKAENLTQKSNSLFDYLSCDILSEILKKEMSINFEKLKPTFDFPVKIVIPEELQKDIPEPIEKNYILAVGRLPFLGKIFPSIKNNWLLKIDSAKERFQQDSEIWKNELIKRKAKILNLQQKHEKGRQEYEYKYKQECQELETFKNEYFAFETNSVISYVEIVLKSSIYSVNWDKKQRIAYSSKSKELLIEFELPNIDIIPTVSEYKYVKSKNEINKKQRKKSELEICYKKLICNISLRTIYEIIKSDQANAVNTICFNGYIISTDPSNGNIVNRVIISILTSKDEFEQIKLEKVDPICCIQGLKSNVSAGPKELKAIKPLKEFSMVDKRFVAEENIASTLDNRPNLMDLDPFEFENLISNLFTKMGLETRQTRSSKDGGVDAIVFDARPVLGGKIVVQAKRYKNTVGVSAARDLYGTMINEGAAKGILVTTSSYGSATYEFSKDKPLELINGNELLYLLSEVGIKAKIIMPE